MGLFDRQHAACTIWQVACSLVLVLSCTGRSEATDTVSPLRVIGGDTPTIELYQNTTGGFPEYEWDIFANEFGFRIADANSFAIPFLIEPLAGDDSFVMKANGNIGLGTVLPNNIGATATSGRILNLRAAGTSGATGVANLVVQGQLNSQLHLVHNGAPANQKVLRFQCLAGTAGFHVLSDNLASYTVPNALTIKMSNGFIGLRQAAPAHPLHLASGARCTTGGVWTNASSRSLKQDIEPLTSEQAREAVEALQPVGYRYKSEPTEKYVGFIAEDVPELVATNDREALGAMDIVAVLTKVVQDQSHVVKNQQAEIRDQKALLQRQQKLLDEQRQAMQTQQTLLTSLVQRLDEIERKTVSESPK